MVITYNCQWKSRLSFVFVTVSRPVCLLILVLKGNSQLELSTPKSLEIKSMSGPMVMHRP